MSTIQLIDRLIAIFECFSPENPELGISEMSRMTGLAKGTVHRLVTALSERGLLQQDELTRTYRLGPKLISLGHMAESRSDLIPTLHPLMVSLRDKSEETVLLSLRSGTRQHFTVHQVESRHAIRMSAVLGKPRPLHLGCGGKAILAFRPEREIEEILGSLDETQTPRGVTLTAAEILESLQRVRELGYAETSEEYTTGATGIGVPLLDRSGYAFASLYIVGPVDRFTSERKRACLDDLIEVGRSISTKYRRPTTDVG